VAALPIDWNAAASGPSQGTVFKLVSMLARSKSSVVAPSASRCASARTTLTSMPQHIMTLTIVLQKSHYKSLEVGGCVKSRVSIAAGV
jgi:hypothetical protein